MSPVDFYNSRFRKFDLAFGVPIADSCCKCDELKIQIEAAEDEDTADALRVERRQHLCEADRVTPRTTGTTVRVHAR
jgi:hypothetical protein